MKHFAREYNPELGIQHDYYWDDAEERLVVRNRHDVTDIIESNKRAQNDTIDQRYGGEMMHHVADIPLAVVYEWKTKFGVDVFNRDHMPKVKRLLNDPDYRYLKTTVKKL